uniref:Hsp70 n=1 Tax=Ganoderma boninense TaxID=34458 RepID=A0A5K1JW73_9APHY|nr:Hsp70 [Ganoderma boninense]
MEAFGQELPKFSAAIQDYERVYPEKNWNFPKMHTHQHTLRDILTKGVTRNYNTKPFEKMHGALKDIYQERTNFKDVDKQITKIEHQFLISKTIRARIDTRETLLLQSKLPEAKPDPYQFGPIHLGALQAEGSFVEFEARHVGDQAFNRFHIRLGEYINRISLGGITQWFTVKPRDMFTESRYIKVDYESAVSWRALTDHLRCNPKFQNHPRYDCVIYKPSGSDAAARSNRTIAFARLKLVFLYKFQDNTYPFALIEGFDVVGARSAVDTDLGLCRVRSRLSTEFILVDQIIRGALLVKDHGQDNDHDYFVVDTVDSDMFLQIRQDVPLWNT